MHIAMEPAKSTSGVSQTLSQQVEHLVRRLLIPQNREELEQFRFHGSTNRVYQIPLAPDSEQFVIVKILPSKWLDLKNRSKRALRNILYGEHDVSAGGKRVQFEIERALEWQREGLPVPPLIQTSLCGVRIFLGLPYPTFYTVLSDQFLPTKRKLQVFQSVVKALSTQHELALERGKKSLIHRDPGPWNIMFDLDNDQTYWFDLEHPADYPKMTLEALMVRAVRIFFYGVLEHLADYSDEVSQILVENYSRRQVILRFVSQADGHRSLSSQHLIQRLVWGHRFHSRQLIRQRIRHYLGSPVSKS